MAWRPTWLQFLNFTFYQYGYINLESINNTIHLRLLLLRHSLLEASHQLWLLPNNKHGLPLHPVVLTCVKLEVESVQDAGHSDTQLRVRQVLAQAVSCSVREWSEARSVVVGEHGIVQGVCRRQPALWSERFWVGKVGRVVVGRQLENRNGRLNCGVSKESSSELAV